MGAELFALPLLASLCAFGAAALVVHALASLAPARGASAFKRYTAKQMLIAFLVMLASALAAGGRAAVRTAGGLLRWWVLFAAAFTAFSLVYVTYTEYPEVWLGTARFYNGNVGPWVHATVLLPLKVTDVLLRALLPLWDSGVWFSKALAVQGLLPLLVDEAQTVLRMATSLLNLAGHLSDALLAWVESFFCVGAACLHPEKGVLDLMTPMGDVREFVALGGKLARGICGTLAAPVDLLLFPLLDLNLAEAVHHLANAAAQLLTVVPRATAERCRLAAGVGAPFDALLCTPDLAPVFHLLAAALGSLGMALDNWLNVALAIVETVVLGADAAPKCEAVPGAGLMPDLVAASGAFPGAGAGAGVVVVGLTDWLYAVTDGATAVYLGQGDTGQARVQAWPYRVDVGLGVAAVSYAGVQDLDVGAAFSGGPRTSGAMQTTAMLGCNCTDSPAAGLRLQCAILPMSGVPTEAAREDYALLALFPDPEAARLYTCAGVDVYVKPVRWSYTRYSPANGDASLGSAGDRGTLPLGATDCIARGACREVDATVWVVPRCGQEQARQGNDEKACLSGAPCFPFCMAARSAGSGRDNLILAPAARWREGLILTGRDCAIATTAPALVGQTLPEREGSISWASASAASSTPPLFAAPSAPQECQRAPLVTTAQPRQQQAGGGANVRVSGQPFAITGDTALVEEAAASWQGGTRAVEGMSGNVQVERLAGDERGAFSLRALAQSLPTLERVLVPMDEATRTDTSRVTVPYSYAGASRIAAANSRDYVFYASNPNLDVFGAYFEYCARKDSGSLARMGLLARSSFSPMRVYRVAAYRRCAAYSCGPDLARFVTLDGFDDERFDKACNRTFNVSVVALEYLNEANVAVTVQSSHVREYDPATLRFGGGDHTRRTTYWLHPATMRLSRSVWQTAVPASSFATLCPAMQRLPRAGSFMAEVATAGVFVLKWAVQAATLTPGMVRVWRAGRACPPAGAAALYHAGLGDCGAGLYSLDDFFDSVDDAGALFWHSLSQLGRLAASPAKPSIAAPLTEVMDGLGQYGEAMIDLWSARAGILTLTRVPVKEQLAQLWGALQPEAEGGGTTGQGLSYGSAALGGWSRFAYKAVSGVAQAVAERALAPDRPPLTAGQVFRLIWATLYDLQGDFERLITAKTRMGCAGLRLVLGTDNPWAALLYHQCAAAAELTGGLMGVALDVFVQVPMARCVCKQSAGADVAAFAAGTCAEGLPLALVPTLYAIANEVRYGGIPGALYRSADELRCSAVLARVRADIAGSLDAWFEHQQLGLEALGSAADYALKSFDRGAGDCANFADDPHVVVLVPQPVDYFQRCAGTSRCMRNKCAAQWEQFQRAARPPRPVSTPLVVTTESAFFPSSESGLSDPTLVLQGEALATTEVPPTAGVCLARPRTSPPDYALAVAERADPSGVRVRFWCAPLMGSAGLYRNETSGYGSPVVGPPGGGATVVSAQFGGAEGEWLAVLLSDHRVYVVNRTGAFATPDWAGVLQPRQVLMRAENLWVVQDGVVLVDLVTRRVTTTGSEATGLGLDALSEAVHVFLPSPGADAWLGTGVDLMAFGGGGYWYTREPAGEGGGSLLFLPRHDRGLFAHRVRLQTSVDANGQPWLRQDLGPPERLAMAVGVGALAGTVMAARMLAPGLVFSVRADPGRWDWLRQTRVDADGFVQGVYGSARVEIQAEVEGRCDELGCEGCGTLQVQRLCLAYAQCALINCVGTPVHQTRPLCGVGGLLRHFGEMALQATHGAWAVFTEMLGLTLELRLLTLQEARLLWPDDAFMCHVCEAKDATAEFFSILTATLNTALQAGNANVAFLFGGASNVDTNADAALTISATALNGFMHQAALLPLFMMVASRQIMMCQASPKLALLVFFLFGGADAHDGRQVTGVLALLDEGEFKLTLRQAGRASAADAIAGQCLPVGAEVLAAFPGDSPKSVATTVASAAGNALHLLLVQQVEPLLHMTDAALAYAIGLVHSLGVLVMANNMAKCNPPQFDLPAVLRCACDDFRLQIPLRRRREGLQQGALWCTGVLSMLDGNGQPFYIYNRYTYEELQALSAGLEAYAACVSATAGGYGCSPPGTQQGEQFLRQQGVTVTNVLIKCRDNFVRKQWDPMAFAYYNREYHRYFAPRLSGADARITFPNDGDPLGIRACLQQADAGAIAGLAQRCLQSFLLRAGISWDDYWAYERLESPETKGPEYTDACAVFTGPASRQVPLFAECVDGGSDGRCTLAGSAWTPLSENQVPVGLPHRVVSLGAHADGTVQLLYAAARAKVLAAVNASLSLQRRLGSSHLDVEFFSVEGDVLHQTMDCMFMGPYARVDYWPIPACEGEEEDECLAGPYWARAEGARGVDPDRCASPPTLPYTCGSPARQAFMRHLVRSVLPKKTPGDPNAKSVIHETVVGTLEQIYDAWKDTGRFGCACADGAGRFAPACCGPQLPLLPPHLNQTFMAMNSTRVLQAMADDLGDAHLAALETVEPWLSFLPAEEAERYRAWNASRRVRDEARFDPTRPVAEYTAEAEALVPLASPLWDVCHAALKQTFFTLPLRAGGGTEVDFDPELAAYDGDPAKLRQYVRNFTLEAWRRSPLFRHYSPRHRPSRSGMCASGARATPAEDAQTPPVAFASFEQGGTTLLPADSLPQATIPAFSAARFTLGEDACLCGWARQAPSGRCQVPTLGNTHLMACTASGACSSATNFTYAPADEARVLAAFEPGWFCPEFELSPHWGFTDDAAADAWLNRSFGLQPGGSSASGAPPPPPPVTADMRRRLLQFRVNNAGPGQQQPPGGGPLVTSARELLQHGRAGVRAGNVWSLPLHAKGSIHPGARAVPLERGRLTTCEDGGEAHLGIIDELLFPAAQAVDEGGAAAYCARYVLELARQTALEEVLGSDAADSTLQRERTAVWERRCGAQLHLLHLCVGLGVYGPRRTPDADTGASTTRCPHFRLDPESARRHRAYATKECLVGVDDGAAFYDPCRCVPCTGQADTPLDLGQVLGRDRCRLRFDPRRPSLLGPAGGPAIMILGWVEGEGHPLPAPAQAVGAEGRLARELMEDPDALGNVGGQGAWWEAEGPMQDEGDGAHCDGVLDWWPEEWAHPVGYHVTVPCEAEATAHRSFAQAFALDEETGALVYEHDLLRDAGLADSHFGVGGLCRRGSFGMPLFETNNMVYCTSTQAASATEGEDFAVPWAQAAEEGAWDEWRCAASSRDVPWPSAANDPGRPYYEASQVSVGTVPHLPGDPQATTYPAAEGDMSEVGPWQDARNAQWGATDQTLCQDFPLALCATDADCPPGGGYACRGRVCSGDLARRCTADANCSAPQRCAGVCMDARSSSCVRHEDCGPQDMCTGVGRCARPVVVVQNRLPVERRDDPEWSNNISFSLAAAGGDCGAGARNFSLVGGSYWGNTGQDLLRVHGMCSFEDWYKYSQYYTSPACSTAEAGGGRGFRVDPVRCSILRLTEGLQNLSRWWPAGAKRPELMYLRPTNCDRDYERLEGFAQCAPRTDGGARVRLGDGEASPTEFDAYVRLHDEATQRVPLADMPERNNTLFGVLGLGGEVERDGDISAANGAHRFVPCALIGQCFGPTFTVNGAVTNRTYRNQQFETVPYEAAVVFRCGVFGLPAFGGLAADACRLDTEVLPLYTALCAENDRGGLRQCKRIVSGGASRLCENIRLEYEPTNLHRTSNLQGLKELFYAFPAFVDIEGYLAVMDCMEALYATLAPPRRSRGLYYPMMFVLKEMPFDWFFQCIVMGGLRVNEAIWRPQDCVAYKERGTHTLDAYQSVAPAGDSLGTYLRYVRGGYTRPRYDAFLAERLDAAKGAVRLARAQVQGALFPGGDADLSLPVCSRNLLWRIGPWGQAYSPSDPEDPDLRAIIANWYDPQSCRSTWHQGLLDDLPPSFGITANNWETRLSTFDPVDVLPQSSPERTLLDEIEAFMVEGMRVEEEPRIQNNARGGLAFDAGVRARYDLAARPVSRELIPMRSLAQGERTTATDTTLSLTCAYTAKYDPAYTSRWPGQAMTCRNLRSALGRKDTLHECAPPGGALYLPCTSVPVVAVKNGQFNCRYQAAGDIIPSNCTEAVGATCYTAVLAAMYAAVLKEFQQTEVGRQPRAALDATALPWFAPGAGWGMANFNLSDELDYERNIQPNPELSVMCEITAAGRESAIKFTECNSPHYAALKAHARAHYKRQGAVVVPAGAQLEWPVDRAVLARGVVLSYARRARPLNQTYLDGLFDDETVCKGPVVATQRVCWNKGPQEFATVNPWLLGSFNPFEACDVDWTETGEGEKEYIYTRCLEDNPLCKAYLQQALPARCKALDRRLVSFPGVPRAVAGRSLDYNLCFRRMEEDAEGCLHDQGLLGGFDGSPVAPPASNVNMLADTKYAGAAYRVGSSLYEPGAWAIPDDFRQGPYASGANPLWHGGDAPYGHLQVRDTDIGGHRIGLVVARTGGAEAVGTLAVERLPLLGGGDDSFAGGGFLDDAAAMRGSKPTSQWVQGLQAAMLQEDAAVRALHQPLQAASALGASCPLQRWTFYSGGYTAFSPAIPGALRAQRLFHAVHGGKQAHPTMRRANRGDYLGRYRSANGFCACPVLPDIPQQQCLVRHGNTEHPCSLPTTIRALRGQPGEAFMSYVFPPLDEARATRRCRMQLDWPNVDGMLRDGSNHTGDWRLASSPTHKQCHVLDRFRPFRYRYHAVTDRPLRQTPPGATTIDAGVCQTARVASLPAARRAALAGMRCLRTSPLSPDADLVRLACNASAPTAGDELLRVLQRRRRETRAETLARRKGRRVRCGQCSPPPPFRTARGVPLPPESSFGRLYRPSTERRLARDLREALGAACATPNETAWRPGEFMRNFLFAPKRLCPAGPAPQAPPAPPPAPPSPPASDAALWGDGARPWVYCPTTQALRTGVGCGGTMRREDWVRRRTELCPQLVRSFSSGAAGQEDPLARTPFCNLDNTTDLVCRAVAEAQALVRQANCIARGDSDCMPSPFVYQPASFERSNNAWVRDSVEAFYLRVNASACPANGRAREERLREFARAYQQRCPANSLTLVKQLLTAVRVVVTDVTLLLSSMLSLSLRLLALLVSTGDLASIRQGAADQWQYIKQQGRQMLTTVSDLLVDALLNSGPLGARIMGFLDASCANINKALAWFLHVWCRYVQKYLIQVMAALRKLVGTIGAGFEMVQDFVDEIFQGILPEAFIAKYAVQGFQEAMAARYSQPTSHKSSQGNARNHVPTSANARPVSRIARARDALANAGRSALGFLSSPVGRVGGVMTLASLGLAGYDIARGIMQDQRDEYLRKLMPPNFTLFGYTQIVNTFDDMEGFLAEDVSCYQMYQYERLGLTYQVFPCLNLTLTRYYQQNPGAGTTSIDATQCWADAAPSVGQSSLYACTAASTCCDTPACETRRVCGACPTPALALTNQYGCHSALRKCVCGTPRLAVDRCAANLHCDAGAQCELVSAASGARYGALPCRLCPSDSQVLCLLNPARGLPGGCACMLERVVQLDTCSDASGMETSVDSARLCGYLTGQSPLSTRWTFDMENLMVVPCSEVATGVCSTVYNAKGGATLRIVVAATLRGSGSGQRRRRRLLSLEEAPLDGPEVHADGYEDARPDAEQLRALLLAPEWERAAPPCGPLALAYQAGESAPNSSSGARMMPLLERLELERCGFWRLVGRRVLARHNLTGAVRETFVVSLDDLARLRLDEWRALLLAGPLSVAGSVLLHHPWTRPIRALGVEVANQLEFLWWTERQAPGASGEEPEGGGPEEPEEPEAAPPMDRNGSAGGLRRLLSVVDAAQSVAAYTAQTLQMPPSMGRAEVPARVAGAWSTASFTWPPVYNYSLSTCPLGLAGLDLGRQAALVTALYFRNFRRPLPPIDRSLRGNLPSWPKGAANLSLGAVREEARSWASWTFHRVLALGGIRPADLVAFFTTSQRWSLQWILETSIKCDLAAVVTCSRHDRDLVMSTVIFLLAFLLIRSIGGALGLGWAAWAFLLSYPGFILWYVFGMPLSCLPMVPTCLLSDVIATLEALVPARLEFPPELACANQTCLRSCEALNFTGWADPLAFAACDTDPQTCQWLREGLPAETGIGLVDTVAWHPLRGALERAERAVVAGKGMDARRLCTWVSFVTATPALAALAALGVLAGAAAMAALDLVPSLVAFLGQLFVFASAQ